MTIFRDYRSTSERMRDFINRPWPDWGYQVGCLSVIVFVVVFWGIIFALLEELYEYWYLSILP